MVICEVCGKNVLGGFKVNLEGSQVIACERCAGLGQVVSKVDGAAKPKKKPVQPMLEQEPSPVKEVEVEYELVDDYGAKVKAAREKMGLTQEDLGMAINEPHSVIHRMELGKYEPPIGVVHKIEHKLRVSLLTKSQDDDVAKVADASKDLTLGDMIVVRKRDK